MQLNFLSPLGNRPIVLVRIVTLVILPIQILTIARPLAVVTPPTTQPSTVSVSGAMKGGASILPDPTANVKVNHKLPVVASPKVLAFTSSPKDAEFALTNVFPEPLIPVGGKTTSAENKALAVAISSFTKAADPEQTEILSSFLEKFPNAFWRASLLANLGAIYRSTGYWSKALGAWEDSWHLLAKEKEPNGKALGDFVLGELAQMNARLGRCERLEALFAEIGDRDVRGPATEKLAGARQGLGLMRNRPQDAFRCGPMALDRILLATNKSYEGSTQILESRSTNQGMSLVEVNRLAGRLGMSYQMAKRSPGAPVIYPAVVNWKVGHFGALTREVNGKFLCQDPTFTDDVWVTSKALDEEGSGYYLVPSGRLPPGWQAVGPTEGEKVWGKGNAAANSKPAPPGVAPMIKQGCSTPGMADYNVDVARVSLSISDTPLGYTPPRGAAVNFNVSYQQREVAPVSIPTYSNLGNKWSFNWLSYIVVDPNNASANATGYGPGGGTLDYTGFNISTQSYAPQLETQVILVKTGAATYEKRFPDGSKQLFALSDGATVYPRKIFMTQSVDPAGNALLFTYDGNFRLVGVGDALGQVTTLSYELPSDPLKLTKVADPFGRTATLQYNGAGQLWKITDPVGLVSQFTYSGGDFINKMTTPYGDTTFVMGESGANYRWLEITDPQGAKERVEYNSYVSSLPYSDPGNTVPSGITAFNQFLNYRTTYYWDKKATAEAYGDYTKARITHWLHTSDINVASDVPESSKLPLERRVWNSYPGSNGYQLGNTNKPSKVGRVLDDGTTQLYQYEYNVFGKITKATDPSGRSTTFVYADNSIDLLEIHQTTGGMDERLAIYTYNAQHLPLTVTDPAGQTTIYSYFSSGQLHTVTNAKQEITTYNYDASGYLLSVIGAVPGAITSFTYDSYGRLRTATDPGGYNITIDYDAIDGDPAKTMDRVAKITHPDGSYEQVTYNRLDPEWTRDRLGRWSRKFYDALRHVVATQDPLNRIILYGWCNCGSLESITDQNGNITSWIRDIQGRLTDKFYPDRSNTHYSYENTTSRLKMVTDAEAQSTNVSYFVDNNVQQVSYTNALHATPNVSYTYNANYGRLRTMTDGIGLTTYTYNPISAAPTLGAGKLASIDGPLDNDATTYGYDELGRVTNRSINGAANAASVQYDSLGRVQSVTNALGTFNYVYVTATERLDHVDLPNGQKTQYSYLGNQGDQRLKQIKNFDPSNGLISQFDYISNPIGQITSWTQANSALANPRRYDFGYDAADQLRTANLIDSSTGAALSQYGYDYDPAGNRTNTQIGTAIMHSTPNNLNQMMNQTFGGKMHFRGTVNEPASVTVGGNGASVDWAGNFDGTANVSVGINTVAITATDVNGNSSTNNYQVSVPGGVNASFVYDLNGNLTSDGSKTYEWDAANRLVAINYNGSADRTEFSYDGLSRCSQILEKNASTITSTKKLIWCSTQLCEERDTSNSVTKRFFEAGEQIAGINYLFNRDHLGSVRELTDSTGAVRARYDYDPYGVRTKINGDTDSDFGFTGFYYHTRSGLNLAVYRPCNAELGRWISRDPIEEGGGINLYRYVGSNPINAEDPVGLDTIVLIDHSAVWGFGHIAILVGNNGTGWTYYSRNGYGSDRFDFGTGDSVLRTYATYGVFKRDTAESNRYQEAYHIRTTLEEDLRMTTYGDEHYRDPYHTKWPPSDNCADLTGEVLGIGNRPVPNNNAILGGIEIPNRQFNSLKGSNLGRLWNVFP